MNKILERTAQYMALATLITLPVSTTATVILFFLTSALSLASGNWHEKYQILRSHPVALGLWGLYALLVIGSLYSIGSAGAIEKQLLRFSWVLLTPLWIPLFIESKWRERALITFLVMMGITLLLSYLKYHAWLPIPLHFWTLLGPRYDTTTTEVFKDHLVQGFLMSIAVSITLYRFLNQNQRKVYYGLFALLGTVNILLMAKGRTGYIILMVLLGYTLLTQLGFKKGVLSTLVLVAGFGVTLYYVPSPAQLRAKIAIENVQEFHQGHQATSLGYRYAWMKNAWTLIKARPWIGYGTGGIEAAYARLPQQATRQTGVVENASNAYLNIALQLGLLGALYFIMMLWVQWRYSAQLPSEWRFVLRSTLIAISVGSLANSWFMDFTQSHCYAIFLAFTFAALPIRLTRVEAINRANNDDVATDTHA